MWGMRGAPRPSSLRRGGGGSLPRFSRFENEEIRDRDTAGVSAVTFPLLSVGALLAGMALAAEEISGYRWVVALLGAGAVAWAAHRHHTRAVTRERLRADTDPLTRALTRSAFLAFLERQQARVANGGTPAAVLLADIDRFKRVNDTYRHVTGDRVLQEVVSRLEHAVRPGDVVGRWGGDELVVLAPGLDRIEGAIELGERLRRAVFAERFETDAGPLRVTLSIGATLLDGGTSAEATVDRADQALYRAKRRRNTVVGIQPIREEQPVPLRPAAFAAGRAR
jgi:diguanylate cyclase (GGDEF)-like protein